MMQILINIKLFEFYQVTDRENGAGGRAFLSGNWRSTSAISSISSVAGVMVAGSYFSVQLVALVRNQ
jgi:hypothetical protein